MRSFGSVRCSVLVLFGLGLFLGACDASLEKLGANNASIDLDVDFDGDLTAGPENFMPCRGEEKFDLGKCAWQRTNQVKLCEPLLQALHSEIVGNIGSMTMRLKPAAIEKFRRLYSIAQSFDGDIGQALHFAIVKPEDVDFYNDFLDNKMQLFAKLNSAQAIEIKLRPMAWLLALHGEDQKIELQNVLQLARVNGPVVGGAVQTLEIFSDGKLQLTTPARPKGESADGCEGSEQMLARFAERRSYLLHLYLFLFMNQSLCESE